MQAVQTQRHFIAIVELDWLRSIDARFMQDVKILAIDGKAPGDAGYPLLVSTGAAREAWWAEAERRGRQVGAAARTVYVMPRGG